MEEGLDSPECAIGHTCEDKGSMDHENKMETTSGSTATLHRLDTSPAPSSTMTTRRSVRVTKMSSCLIAIIMYMWDVASLFGDGSSFLRGEQCFCRRVDVRTLPMEESLRWDDWHDRQPGQERGGGGIVKISLPMHRLTSMLFPIVFNLHAV